MKVARRESLVARLAVGVVSGRCTPLLDVSGANPKTEDIAGLGDRDVEVGSEYEPPNSVGCGLGTMPFRWTWRRIDASGNSHPCTSQPSPDADGCLGGRWQRSREYHQHKHHSAHPALLRQMASSLRPCPINRNSSSSGSRPRRWLGGAVGAGRSASRTVLEPVGHRHFDGC